jgi:NAD(P)-dependent dehydrogenase (short-subunit alcohol dehydrogenase family)
MNKSVVLITGASTGVGGAAAVAFAKKDARVVVAGRREGITKSAALEIVKSGTRVNGVASGPSDTCMLTRFTGTRENKAAPVTGVPRGRVGKLPTRSCSSHRTKPRSLPATSSTSTAVTVRTEPVRICGIARGSRRLRPTPDQPQYISSGRKNSNG